MFSCSVMDIVLCRCCSVCFGVFWLWQVVVRFVSVCSVVSLFFS